MLKYPRYKFSTRTAAENIMSIAEIPFEHQTEINIFYPSSFDKLLGWLSGLRRLTDNQQIVSAIQEFESLSRRNSQGTQISFYRELIWCPPFGMKKTNDMLNIWSFF